ncbi:MAG: hypothetical protein DRG30_06355 [Epsilonproteobacteria bacterium]|nr:MAG: hypothetical protein DRG30_06355 [Campylobacterota bacterium]
MKILLSIIISAVLMLNFTACGGSDSEINTNVPKDDIPKDEINPGPFQAGEYGQITLTTEWIVPDGALFLDIRNDWERVEMRAQEAVGGALYEYREKAGNGSERYINPNFYEDVLVLADDENREVILICNSGSRTKSAAKLLSDRGFTNIWYITGGMGSWAATKPSETIINTPL